MKNIMVCMLLLFCLHAGGQTYQWARSSCGNGTATSSSFIQDTKCDNSGHIYSVGGFSPPFMAFGADTVWGLDSPGFCNLFLVKYDSLGNILWLRSGDLTCNAQAWQVAIDKSGYIYIIGYFNSDHLTLGSHTLYNIDSGTNDLFIAKYDPDGNVLWAKRAGGNNYDNAWGIAVNDSVYVYMSGWFKSDSISFDTFTLHNNGLTNGFLVKYDSLGNVLWARQVGSYYDDEIYPVACDATGNVYVGGCFLSASISIGSDTLINHGVGNIFIAKYDALGNVKWARSFKGDNFDQTFGLSLDNFGHLYVSGNYRSTSLNIDSVTLENSSPTTDDPLLVKLDTNGYAIWGRTSTGSDNFDAAYPVKTDKFGNIYLGGNYSSDSIKFGTVPLLNSGDAGTSDIFLVCYDSTGSVMWDLSARGVKDDGLWSLSLDNAGNIYCGGTFYSPHIYLGSIVLNNADVYNAFLFKLNPGVLNLPSEYAKYTYKVFPNPTAGNIRIEFAPEQTIKAIEIDNILGQPIPFELVATGNADSEIKLKGGVTGVIILKITGTNNSVVYSKIVVADRQ
jgi:Secretion system C-terminal sorting domain